MSCRTRSQKTMSTTETVVMNSPPSPMAAIAIRRVAGRGVPPRSASMPRMIARPAFSAPSRLRNETKPSASAATASPARRPASKESAWCRSSSATPVLMTFPFLWGLLAPFGKHYAGDGFFIRSVLGSECETFGAGTSQKPQWEPRGRSIARRSYRLAGSLRGRGSSTSALLNHGVVPAAAVKDVDPGASDEHVVPGFAVERVVAIAADQNVVAIAAVGGQLDRAREQPRGLDHVVAGPSVDGQPIAGRLGAGDVHLRCQHQHGHAARIAGDEGNVIAAGPLDDHRVGPGEVGGLGQVQVDLDHVGTAQIVDGDLVGPAEGVEVDSLDVVEVHGDGGDVAEEGDTIAGCGRAGNR